ncbi:MAG: cell filamentation protein Fic [Candidatus Levybacteria bacterium CG_4_10_14_0_8_um_filter_35_23]|nr:MAG: cell filamentation protein Fic [Candidatus Levybacteria bacterium CG_4_10_14_0_8_um_filter_35_23]
MAISNLIKNKIKVSKQEYDSLKKGKDSLLKIIDEVEISEIVYNSNAIENSTLTLKETEKILLEMEVSKEVSLREVFEAKNLARVVEYIRIKSSENELSREMILLLHQMLMNNINDEFVGRFRLKGEYVKVGLYIAPAPEKLEKIIEEILNEYANEYDKYFLDKIAKFHLDFENTHPFVDGNGRIGRVLMNFQLQRLGFPNVIIRNIEKQNYYNAFNMYRDKKDIRPLEKVIFLALSESLNKRIAYLNNMEIIDLTEYAKLLGKPAPVILNAGKRQTIPAFREKGVWKIAQKTH